MRACGVVAKGGRPAAPWKRNTSFDDVSWVVFVVFATGVAVVNPSETACFHGFWAPYEKRFRKPMEGIRNRARASDVTLKSGFKSRCGFRVDLSIALPIRGFIGTNHQNSIANYFEVVVSFCTRKIVRAH